jgi:hypothetical protein
VVDSTDEPTNTSRLVHPSIPVLDQSIEDIVTILMPGDVLLEGETLRFAGITEFGHVRLRLRSKVHGVVRSKVDNWLFLGAFGDLLWR